MIAALIMLSLPQPSAPMPVELPSYRVLCTAGEMTGLVRRFSVEIAGQDTDRLAEITDGEMRLTEKVTPSRLPLTEAVGGKGFQDHFSYELGGQSVRVNISVRGDVNDGLFAVSMGIFPPNSEPRGLRGACYRLDVVKQQQDKL